eukprot:Selendium_serpulae@DN6452_c0_g3_i1.p1
MGSEVSGCCAVEKAADKAVITQQEAEKPREKEPAEAAPAPPEKPAPQTPPEPQPPPPEGPSDEEVAAFQERILGGMDVVVLLADGTGLTCALKLITENAYALEISADKNLRLIPFSELKAILYGKDQLKRVETKANLIEDPQCVALHMVTGNCIPMRFDTVKGKECFVTMLKKLRAQQNN